MTAISLLWMNPPPRWMCFRRGDYDAVFEALKDKTVIFVSHRLSSVTACDKIIYMDHGKILEEGTHESLMHLQGGYYRLFQAQFT